MPKGTWIIPNAALVGKQQVWKILDEGGWVRESNTSHFS